MRFRNCFGCMLIVAIFAQPLTAQEPLLPSSLLNWLRILDDDEYRLLTAADQNNSYFSVRVDSDGDILFATQDNLRDSQRNPRSFTLRVMDLKGNDLHDMKSTKSNPKAKEIVYSSRSKIGAVESLKSVTVAYSAGAIYPLVKNESREIRIRYVENVKDGKTIELFNRIVVLPAKQGVTK